MMTNTLRKTLFVLGNGPSLRGVDLTEIGDKPALGMNAAYRYWDSIGWYPMIYCCLDDVVVVSHQEEIRNLIKKRLCKIFFLHPNILIKYPDLVGLADVYFLSSFLKGDFHNVMRERYGLPRYDPFYFKSCNPGKITTGSYSIRFGAFLGFECFYLKGIDLQYVEILPEAKRFKGGEYQLQIVETPKSNPNYFFDDYQKEGDTYNIPNPVVHNGNLHLQSFQALAQDFANYARYISLFVSTKKSLLFTENIFPYADYFKEIKNNNLDVVVMMCTEKELSDVVLNLTFWDSPSARPYQFECEKTKVDLRILFNKKYNKKIVTILTQIFNESEVLRRSFSSFDIWFADLSEEQDVYNKKKEGVIGKYSYVDGPNNLFYRFLLRASEQYHHALMLEPDCWPIRPGWLSAFEDLAAGDDYWVKGSYYRGKASPVSFLHTNGCALYHVANSGLMAFADKMRTYFKKRSVKHKVLSFDIILWDYFRDVFSRKANPELMQEWKNVYHNIKYTSIIQDYTAQQDIENGPVSLGEARSLHPDAYILHGRHFCQRPSYEKEEIANLICNKQKLGLGLEFQGVAYTAGYNIINFAGKPTWIFKDTNKKHEQLKFIWKLEHNQASSDLCAEMEIKAITGCKLRISLARHGEEDYSGSSIELVFHPNEFRKVCIEWKGQQRYKAIKVQIEVLFIEDPNIGCVLFSVDNLSVIPTVVFDLWEAHRAGLLPIISLNPDLISEFGHYLHYDVRLASALKSKRSRLLTLANADVNLDNAEIGDASIYPILEFRSYEKLSDINAERKKRVYSEIKLLSQTAKRLNCKFLCFFYMMPFWNGGFFSELLASEEMSGLRFLLNISCIYFPNIAELRESNLNQVKAPLAKLAKVEGVRLSADTEGIVKWIKDVISIDVSLLPTFAVNTPGQNSSFFNPGSKIVAYYPSNAQKAKGFDLLPDFCRALSDLQLNNKIQVVTRYYMSAAGNHEEMLNLRNSLPRDVLVVEGELKQEEYDRYFAQSHIILLPYRVSSFRNRTSGQLLEALLCGKPVIAARETWLGDILTRFGCGVVFRDGDPNDMAKAVAVALTEYSKLVECCKLYARHYFQFNSVDKAAEFLLNSYELNDLQTQVTETVHLNADKLVQTKSTSVERKNVNMYFQSTSVSIADGHREYRKGNYQLAAEIYAGLYQERRHTIYLQALAAICRRDDKTLCDLPNEIAAKVRDYMSR